MEVIGESIVERDPYPTFRTRVLSAPSLARVGRTVLAVYRSGSAKVSPDGRIEARISADLGATWSAADSPFESPADGLNHAGSHVGSGRSGTVIAVAARFRMTAPGSPDWDAERAGIVDADAIVARRGTSGAWTTPLVVDARRHAEEWAIACGPPVSLGGDEWILPMERHDRSARPDWQQRYHAFALRSHDDGRSWPDEVPMPNDATGRFALYDQRMTVLADARLVSLAWVHDVIDDRTLEARAAWSGDAGRSWSDTLSTSLLGGPINPITLHDGRVLAAYARRSSPAGIRIAISRDGARTWDRSDEIVLYDGDRRVISGEPAPSASSAVDTDPLWGSMWGWTFGSPCPVELDDGSVLVAFFASDETGRSAIRIVRLRP